MINLKEAAEKIIYESKSVKESVARISELAERYADSKLDDALERIEYHFFHSSNVLTFYRAEIQALKSSQMKSGEKI